MAGRELHSSQRAMASANPIPRAIRFFEEGMERKKLVTIEKA
jgi:hypothetical protein